MTRTCFVHWFGHIWRECGSAQGRRLNCRGWQSGHKGPLKTPSDKFLSYTPPYCQACYHRCHGHSGNLQDQTERKERRRLRPLILYQQRVTVWTKRQKEVLWEGKQVKKNTYIRYIISPSSQFSPCLLGSEQRWHPTPLNAGSHLQEPFPLMPSKHYRQRHGK